MEHVETGAEERGRGGVARYSLLVGVALGHAITHWYQQSFFVILPEIKSELGISDVQAGALSGTRSISAGVINLPAGFIADLFRKRWSIIMAASVAWLGIAYFLVGLSPSYTLMLLAVALVGMGGAIWHPPAISALSQRFASRRGFALGVHGVGGSVGDTVAPIMVGVLLLVLTWRHLLNFYAFPALTVALVVWWTMRGVHGSGEGKATLKAYFRGLGSMVRNHPLMVLVLAGALRSMGQMALFTFIPIYLREHLGYSTAAVGTHLSLLTFMGIVSQPVMGFLSDRLGRRAVLMPTLAAMALFSLALVWANPGYQITVVMVLMGLFIYGLAAIFMATGMDLTAGGVEATTVGVLFGAGFLFNSASPVIAGALVGPFGIKVTFIYAAALFALSCALMTLVPLRRRGTAGLVSS